MFNIPNILSVLRILLIIPAALYLWHGNNIACAIITAIASLTDILDGILARKLGQVSELGKVLDPIGDKLFLFVLGGILLWQGRIPVWFVILYLVRDLLIIAGGIYAKRKINFVLPSLMIGKLTAFALGAVIFFITLDVPYIREYGLPVVTFLLAASFLIYTSRFLRELRSQGN